MLWEQVKNNMLKIIYLNTMLDFINTICTNFKNNDVIKFCLGTLSCHLWIDFVPIQGYKVCTNTGLICTK